MKNQMDFNLDTMGFNDSNHIRVCRFNELAASRFHDQVTKRAMMDPVSPIVIYIDSFGGEVDALASMLETLESVPNKIITVCIGKAMSCGAILLSAGDYRFCGKHSRIMIHPIGGASAGDAYTMKITTEEANRMNEYWLNLFAKNCGLDGYSSFKALLDKETSREIYFDALKAKAFGIIDEIGMPDIRPAILFSVNSSAPRERKIAQKAEQNLTFADLITSNKTVKPATKVSKNKKKK